MVHSYTRHSANKWTINSHTPGGQWILSTVRKARHATTPPDAMWTWDRYLGVDTALDGNDTTHRPKVCSMCMDPNAVFPPLAPTTTASNIVDLGTPCLVLNARAAPPNVNGLHWLYATVAMEGIQTAQTPPTSGKLPGNTVDAKKNKDYAMAERRRQLMSASCTRPDIENITDLSKME